MHLNIGNIEHNIGNIEHNNGNIEHNMSNIALGVYKFIIKEQHLHSKQTALLTTLGNVKRLSIYYVVQIWGPERPCCCVVGQNLI